MIDNKLLLCSIKKLLDIFAGQGFIWGKFEVDFDIRAKRIKAQVHQFENINNEKIIRTTILIK